MVFSGSALVYSMVVLWSELERLFRVLILFKRGGTTTWRCVLVVVNLAVTTLAY